MEFIDTTKPTVGGRLSGLYLGGALSGKTTLICSWPGCYVASFDPDTTTLRKHSGVLASRLTSWTEYESQLVPQVRARNMSKWASAQAGREVKVETIAVDTISIGSTMLAQFVQGGREKLTQPDFGRILNKFNTTTMHLLEATAPAPGKESYNILFTAHLTTVTDDEGNVLAIRPAILGAFKELLPRLVGFTFLCESKLDLVEVAPKQFEKRERYYVRTARPSSLYDMGDRIGGEPGQYKKLPIECPGDYKSLCALWGFDPDAKE